MISLKKALAASALSLAVGAALAVDIPAQAYDAQIAAELPAAIQKAGVLRNVVTGSFVPYTIANPDNSIEGATADFAKAVGEVLGVKVTHTVAQGFAARQSEEGAHARAPQAPPRTGRQNRNRGLTHAFQKAN